MSGTDTTASPAQIARTYFERVAARDPDGMMEHWRPGGIGNIHGIAELRAPDEYRDWFSNLFSAFPDMRFEVIEIVADDDRAAVRWRADATFSGDASFEGMLATGAPVSVQGVDLLTVENGRIVSLEAYLNGAELARQLGALPPPGSVQERAVTGLINLRTRATRALRRA